MSLARKAAEDFWGVVTPKKKHRKRDRKEISSPLHIDMCIMVQPGTAIAIL
jgi:hypothetical protein